MPHSGSNLRPRFCHRRRPSPNLLHPLTMRILPLLFGLAACAAATNIIVRDGMEARTHSVSGGVGVAAGTGNGQAVFIPPASTPATGLSLADALTLERRASLWFDYARDVAAVVSAVGWGSWVGGVDVLVDVVKVYRGYTATSTSSRLWLSTWTSQCTAGGHLKTDQHSPGNEKR